jgi:integrase
LPGLRPEAILSLRWRDIEGDVLFFESTKTKKDGRRVPVVPAVLEALEDLRAAAPAPPDGYVFGYEDGSRCTQGWYRLRFLAAMNAAGLPPLDAEGRKRVPYSFKHSLITHLIDGGADEVLVREYVGHSHGAGFGRILTGTQRRYKHAQTERLRLLLPKIEAILSPPG